jgi:serine/threonine protein kinase
MPPNVEIAGSGGGPGAAATAGGTFAPGTQLAGGRYAIAELLRRASLGELYRATDSTSGHPVGIYLFDPRLGSDAGARARLQQQLADAAGVHHKNLVQSGELTDEDGHLYAAVEYIDGNTLAELIARKRKSGDVFTPKGAYNVVAHLCNAMAHVHKAGRVHAMLHPGNVLVNKAGRVKVAELGLGIAGGAAQGASRAYAAPELLKGGAPSSASDIYSVGALLYELLTGIAPKPGAQPPSKVTLGLPAAVDQVVGRAVAPAPGNRFPDASALKKALQAAIESAGRPSAQHAAQSGVKKRTSLAQQLTADQQSQLRGAGPAATGGGDSALSDTTEKWLISKGKLDYGPFSLAHVIQQIHTDQILPGHTIVDNETGQRQTVEDHPLLADLVDKAKQRRDDARRAQAEVQHVAVEKRRGTTLYGFIALGVVALGVGAYFLVAALSSAKDDGDAGGVARLEEGQLEAKITFKKPKQRTGKGKRRSGGSRGENSRGGGFDEFDGPMDLGDASEGGESERLDDSEINPVISRHSSGLARCLSKTGSRSAHIQFVIRGNGKVSYVKVNGVTGTPLQKCLSGAMKKMSFPSFNGARTRAEFEIGF